MPLAMARLEWGLLRIGGVSDRDLDRLERAYRTAKKALGGGTPAAAFDAFEELSAVVRAAHAGQLAKIEEARAMTWSSSRLSDVAIHRSTRRRRPGFPRHPVGVRRRLVP